MTRMQRLVLAVLVALSQSSAAFRSTYYRISSSNKRISLFAAGTDEECTWEPQDLTKDVPGFEPIPDNDYIKKYQRDPGLWPVEFFLIVYRRNGGRVEILVRKSANGTSKYGIGTGVPVTRWILSSQEPPKGYIQKESPLSFPASGFPEFSSDDGSSWSYSKIDIRNDAFAASNGVGFHDSPLEDYAEGIRASLRQELDERCKSRSPDGISSSWDAKIDSVVASVLEHDNSVAAIQGTLRMSGLFATKNDGGEEGGAKPSNRFLELRNAPDPSALAKSMKMYTMFPQMPDPMQLPSTSPSELQAEIASRPARMQETGRDPHRDKHGRRYTHISTSNVSNTIHGVYMTLDATDLGLEDVPAQDLFGTKQIPREWVSLENLNVLDSDSRIGAYDTKPSFISGFIVRQLVCEGVIPATD